MTKTQIKLNANWKIIYQNFWLNTPKKRRKTSQQIKNIKYQAKVYTLLYN